MMQGLIITQEMETELMGSRWVAMRDEIKRIQAACYSAIDAAGLPGFGTAEYLDDGTTRLEWNLLPTEKRMRRLADSLPPGSKVSVDRDRMRLVFTVPASWRQQQPRIEIVQPLQLAEVC